MSIRPNVGLPRAVDADNRPIAAARAFFYDSGTVTPKPTYSDPGLSVINSNPLIADANGDFADAFLLAGLYDIRIETPGGALVRQWDAVRGTESTLALSGGTLTGFLTLHADPVQPAHAATKRYVDARGLPGTLRGLTLSNGTTPATDVTIAAGVAAADAAPWRLIDLAGPITKTTAAWAEGDGLGGLDTGSVANTSTYYVHVIRNSTSGTVDALLSLSATAPTMPTGYDQRRRLGAVMTDGSGNLRPFWQVGREFRLVTPIFTTLNITTSRQLVTIGLPIGIEARPILRITSSTATNFIWIMSDPREADLVPAAAGNPLFSGVNQASYHPPTGVRSNTSGQVAVRSTPGAGTLLVSLLGWWDDGI